MRHVLMLSLAALTVPFATIAHAAWPVHPDSSARVLQVPTQFSGSVVVHVVHSDGAGGVIDVASGEPGWLGSRIDSDADRLWCSPLFPIGSRDNDLIQTSATAPDGAGGLYGSWERDGIVFLRHTAADGSQPADVTIASGAGNRWVVAVTDDGGGGAIVIFSDARVDAPGIYAQRVDAAGSPLWAAGGVRIANGSAMAPWGRVLGDGAGGAIVAWRHDAGSLRVQRVTANGVRLWGTTGRLVTYSMLAGYQADPATGRIAMAADGDGGFFLTWPDHRFDENGDIYAQHHDSSGTELWDAEGLRIADAVGYQYLPVLVPDAAGGLTVLWDDGAHAWMQHVDATGAPRWTDGVGRRIVAGAGGQETHVDAIPDGEGGLYATWKDTRLGTVFVQRFDADGDATWTADGVAVTQETYDKHLPQLVPSGSGVIVTWVDLREQAPASGCNIATSATLPGGGYRGIYAKRLPFEPEVGVPPSQAAVRFAIRFPIGNRVTGERLQLALDGASGAGVALEIVDVTGRQRIDRMAVPTGATTSVSVATLESGLYFARAIQGDRSAVARFVVVR